MPVPAFSDNEQQTSSPDGSAQLKAANKSDWKSTAAAKAKLLLCGVRDTADAFGPLKSDVGCLCFILENCEVLLSSWPRSPVLTVSQRTKANQETIEFLGEVKIRESTRFLSRFLNSILSPRIVGTRESTRIRVSTPELKLVRFLSRFSLRGLITKKTYVNK